MSRTREGQKVVSLEPEETIGAKEGHRPHSLETEKDEGYGIQEPGKNHGLYILKPGSRKL